MKRNGQNVMGKKAAGYAQRTLRLFLGLFILANGSVLTVNSGVGGNPWLVLNTGMNHTFGISIGGSSILFGCLFVLLAALQHEAIGIGTLVNMIMAGAFTDMVMAFGYIPNMCRFWPGMGMLLLGCTAFLYGTYLYLSSAFGAGPRDCMMVSLGRLLHLPIGVARIIIEAVTALAGYLMGGLIGWGTVVSVILNGPLLQLICHLHRFDPKGVQHETLKESVNTIQSLWQKWASRKKKTKKGGDHLELGLKGKVVVITGGATGIGKEMVRGFLKEGCKVAICSRRQTVLTAAQEEFAEYGPAFTTKRVDVCSYEALTAFADEIQDQYGQIDIWVNNAGANQIKPLMEFSPEEFHQLFQVDLYAVFYGCQIAARKMMEKGGVILNAASFAALAPNAGRAPYSAAKAGVLSLTRTFAAELAPYQIRVLSYVPGMIETDMAAGSISRYREELLKDIPMKRFGRPEEVARVVVFAASDAASYLNGTHIEISGGKRCVQNPWYGYE